jgi:hypothetical protein
MSREKSLRPLVPEDLRPEKVLKMPGQPPAAGRISAENESEMAS